MTAVWDLRVNPSSICEPPQTLSVSLHKQAGSASAVFFCSEVGRPRYNNK